ncbi:bacteriophage tail protein [Neoasaia chiangmaiensis NBRC 101099]|uniref:Phage tail protein n=1 Tax=Neoasaia chiangmaiensis TaxID=320497 RepID=A0A1U9KRA3_9PROT|nr:phage tail protein [Neoasaia chiangmaiensis]AQS88275.1 phage tail protein [Neoasaia chiangmaiensis]GBR39674.1 bacteriophage tail protein [Neoasaia chiangmaiensis NBRC 101099]GEN14691.1 tail protein [Neoasaia chiangmaiensis]
MSGFISELKSILGWDAATSEVASIKVGGQIISGWTSVVIRCGVDIMPWTADFGMTSYQPADGTTVDITSGADCAVYIGTTLVLTGYVVTVVEDLDGDNHTLQISVASKSIDLVDCAAEFSTYQMNGTNALAIAQRVSAFAGINVASINGAGNIDVQQFSIILTETAYEVIERLSRLAGVLFYDQPDGSIALSGVGSSRSASGFQIGRNVERFTRVDSQAGRYSDVTAILATTIMLFTKPGDQGYVDQMKALTAGPVAKDPGVTRPRHMLIPVELGDPGLSLPITTKRVQWEVARRYGRSQPVNVTCDSWRDTEGKLWQPNMVAPVTTRSGRSVDLVIGELTFRQDDNGTHADAVLMPKEAFLPEPIILPFQQNEGIAALSS